MHRFYTQLAEAAASGRPFALGIISATKGSSPQKKGAKALFFADGTMIGTLGGGGLEAELQERARRALASQTPAAFEFVLDQDFGSDEGLICGGKVMGLILPQAAQAAQMWSKLAQAQGTLTWGVKGDFSLAWVEQPGGDWLYQETVAPPCALLIAGAGHIAQAVAPLALQLDFEVTVFDDRPALANPERFPGGTRFCVGPWERLLAEPMPRQPAFGLIVTRGHQHDALVLRHWVRRPFVFLGMIGSRRKRQMVFDQFIAEDTASRAELERVYCPVGLEIQAVGVSEIAVSIAAQLIQKRAEHLTRKQQGNAPQRA